MSAENFSIVVVGDMNPRVHSPLFYKTIHVISDDELAAALESDSTICIPQTAQLDLTQGVRVVCLPNRWQISSVNERDTTRLLDVAVRVMSALDHTPTGAFGFNFDYVRRAEGASDATFAAPARKLPLAFPDAASASANFSYVRTTVESDAKCKVLTHVAPLADPPEHILVKNNFHYDVTLPGYYQLGELMRARFERDLAIARAQATATVEMLKVN